MGTHKVDFLEHLSRKLDPSVDEAYFGGRKFLRHENGRGWRESTSEVSREAFIDRYALVLDRSKVLGMSRVTDSSVILGSGRVGGNVKVGGNSRVKDSAVINGATVLNSYVMDNSLVYDSARIVDSALYGCRIYGDAVIDGCRLKNVRTEERLTHIEHHRDGNGFLETLGYLLGR